MSPLEPARGPFHVEIRVRYEETDAAGVVYYANYLRYFEVARVEGLRAIGHPINDVEAHGVLLPAVSADCRYRRPAHVDDLLDVAMWLDRRGRGSFGFAYEVRRGPDVIATGHTLHAVVERDTMRPLRLDGWIGGLVDLAARWTAPVKETV